MPTVTSRLIPTTSRDNHSKAVSCPLGASVVSRLLAVVPQYELIACRFGADPNQQTMHRLDRYFVFSASYHRQARGFTTSALAKRHGAFDARWAVSVYAVPVGHRHAVKLRLIDALPNSVVPWFKARAALGNVVGQHSIWLAYDVVAQTIVASEESVSEPVRIDRH